MLSNKLILLTLLLLIGTPGCGKKSSGSGATDIDGLKIAGSSYSGMVLAAKSVEQSVDASRVYYYNFATGVVHQLFGAESGDPALFYADGHAFLFNRQAQQKNVRVFDPKQVDPPYPAAIATTDLAEGDPWDLAPLVTGKSVVLAAPLGGALDVLDYTTGEITPVDISSPALVSKSLRPHGVMRAGSRLLVAHAGIHQLSGSSQVTSDDTQQIYVLAVAADGSLSFTDQDTGSAAIDGIKLKQANPSRFLNQDGNGAATLVGLCAKEDWTGCDAGIETLSDAGAVTDQSASELSQVYYQNQVVSGQTDDSVYASVLGADGKNKVSRIDVSTQKITDVHTFSDAGTRLHGIAYDRGSKSLFVGDVSGINGTIAVYQNDKLTGTFDIDGVLYSSAFVP